MSETSRTNASRREWIYDQYIKPMLDRLSDYGHYPLLLPGLIFLAVFFFVPVLILLAISLQPDFVAGTITGFTLNNYVKVFSDGYFIEILLRTILLGIAVAVTTLAIGYPVAYHITRLQSNYQRLIFMLLILVPYLTSVVVRTFGWLIILLQNGLLNTFLRGVGIINGSVQLVNNEYGIYIGLVHVFLPIAVISLMTSLRQIDPELEKAARDLGASRFQVITKILLPLSRGGILGGFLLTFALSISSYTTPSLLGGTTNVMATVIYSYVGQLTDFALAAALATVLMVFAILVVIISNYLGQGRTRVV